MTSFEELKERLVSGEEIRMVTNSSGCNCTYNDCRNLTLGGDIKGTVHPSPIPVRVGDVNVVSFYIVKHLSGKTNHSDRAESEFIVEFSFFGNDIHILELRLNQSMYVR